VIAETTPPASTLPDKPENSTSDLPDDMTSEQLSGMPSVATSLSHLPKGVLDELQPEQVQRIRELMEKFGEGARIVVTRQMSPEEMIKRGVKNVTDDSRRIITDFRQESPDYIICVIKDPKTAKLGVSHKESTDLPPVDAVVEMVTAAKKEGSLEYILGNSEYLNFLCKESDGNRAVLVYVELDGSIRVRTDTVLDDIDYNAAVESEIIFPQTEDTMENNQSSMTIEEAERRVRDISDGGTERQETLMREAVAGLRWQQKELLRKEVKQEHGNLQELFDDTRNALKEYKDLIEDGEQTGDWIDEETGENLEKKLRRDYLLLKFHASLLAEMVGPLPGNNNVVEEEYRLSHEDELKALTLILDSQIQELETKTTSEMSDKFWENATDEQIAENEAAWRLLETFVAMREAIQKSH
jgi:hypothetical protein